MNTQPATFSKITLSLLIATTFGGFSPGLAVADIINITPCRDNTLYQYIAADGDRSNALGLYFFAGETGLGTGQGELRRGVLAFDISGSIPSGSTITSVSLSMNMSMTALDTARTVELHKLLSSWGQGTSQASGGEGMGAPATPNDPTWRHRFFDTIFWTTEGGDFSATVSASQSVGPVGTYMWSSPGMVTDVQSWLDNPSTNFGWLVLGDESELGTAKRFDTRESASPPLLTIGYTPTINGSVSPMDSICERVAPTPRPRPTPLPRP